jgi:long-chain acyl-CoA synthetase
MPQEILAAPQLERPHDAQRAVLLTGATGFVGMELLAAFLEQTDRTVYALVRGRDDAEVAHRLSAVRASLFGSPHAYADRVVAVRGDITQPGMALGDRAEELAEAIGEIVHCAASVSFELGLAESREINVEGTRRMLRFAERCNATGGLRRLSYVSTAYIAGERTGRFGEDDLDVGQRFRNAYEQSKFEAERLLAEHHDRLPLTIFRPSIVVGEQASGWTASFNVLYWPLRAFARGAYVALPARREAPVDVVPVDYVADAILALSQAPEACGRTYHLTAGDEASTVGELVELAARKLERPAPRLLSPSLYRRIVHPVLARVGRQRRRRLVRRSEVYFPYFAMDVGYDDRHARATLEPAGIRPAPLEQYFGRLLDYALAAQWGRQPLGRAEARAAAGVALSPERSARR